MKLTTPLILALAAVSKVSTSPIEVSEDIETRQILPAGTWSAYFYHQINFRDKKPLGGAARNGHCFNLPANWTNLLSINVVESYGCYAFNLPDCPIGAENRSHRIPVASGDVTNLSNTKGFANNIQSFMCEGH